MLNSVRLSCRSFAKFHTSTRPTGDLLRGSWRHARSSCRDSLACRQLPGKKSVTSWRLPRNICYEEVTRGPSGIWPIWNLTQTFFTIRHDPILHGANALMLITIAECLINALADV